MTIPGIGITLAAMIAAEIGDISRFKSAKRLRSYCRLTPETISSGGRTITGPLNKQGNAFLSWALIQAAGRFIATGKMHDTTIYKRYLRVSFKHGCNPAKVSVARDLATIIFAVLRDRRPFDVTRIALADAA